MTISQHKAAFLLIELNGILARLETHLRAEPFTIGVSEIDAALSDYQDELTKLAERARQGELTQDEFERQAEAIVTAALLALFNLGRQSDAAEYEAMQAYEQERVLALEHIRNLANDIYGGRYHEQTEGDTVVLSDEDAQARLESRLVLWAATAAGLYALGQLYREATVKYMWRRGGTLKPCLDCVRLDGQVHTSLDWRLSGYRPQSGGLACGGWNCQCYFIETDDPLSGGF